MRAPIRHFADFVAWMNRAGDMTCISKVVGVVGEGVDRSARGRDLRNRGAKITVLN